MTGADVKQQVMEALNAILLALERIERGLTITLAQRELLAATLAALSPCVVLTAEEVAAFARLARCEPGPAYPPAVDGAIFAARALLTPEPSDD